MSVSQWPCFEYKFLREKENLYIFVESNIGIIQVLRFNKVSMKMR